MGYLLDSPKTVKLVIIWQTPLSSQTLDFV